MAEEERGEPAPHTPTKALSRSQTSLKHINERKPPQTIWPQAAARVWGSWEASCAMQVVWPLGVTLSLCFFGVKFLAFGGPPPLPTGSLPALVCFPWKALLTA